MTTYMFVCHNHNPVLSSFMTYYRVCSKSSTCGAGNAYPLAALEFTPCFQRGSCCSIFSLMCSVFYIIVCLFLFFPLYCLSFFDLRLLTTSLVSSNHSYVQQIYMTTMTPMVSVLLKHVTTSILEWYKYYSLIVCKNLYERVRTCIVQSFVILYLFIPNVRYDFRIVTMFGSSLPTGVCRSPRAYVLFTLLVFVRV